MPGKKPSARKPSGSKARGANPREDAKPRTIKITPGSGEKKSEPIDVRTR